MTDVNGISSCVFYYCSLVQEIVNSFCRFSLSS